MGNLGVDTAVERIGEGQYRATLSPDWAVWGPNGGYLAAVALRAAGAASALARPASLHCSFLSVAAFEPVDLQVTKLRSSRRVESLRVSMTQHDKPVLEATVWAVADGNGAAGPERLWAGLPEIPEPFDLPDIETMVTEAGGIPMPIWQNYETRPVEWVDPAAPERPAGRPRVRGWLRFKHQAVFPDDPWTDACRSVVGVDIAQFPAVAQGFSTKELRFIAPSLDLYAAFHGAVPAEEWLLIEGEGLVAGEGLCGARAKVWSRRGELVASGSQQMLLTVPRQPAG